MTIAASDLADLYLIMPGTETITLSVWDGERDGWLGTTYSVEGAERRPVETKDFLTGGLAAGTEGLVWFLWAANLTSQVPKQNDKITDSSSVVYQINQVTAEMLQQRYRCVCVRMR